MSALTDGDRVQLEVRLAAPSTAPLEIVFSPGGEDGIMASCTVPAGGDSCRSDPLLTLGWRWSGGAARPEVVITARDPDGNTAGTSAPITVRPRPVVMVHGFISTWETWKPYLGPGGYLAEAGLQGFALGDGQVTGQMNTGDLKNPAGRTNTIQQNAAVLGSYIAGVKQSTGAEMVDLLVHSMGGMISRYYIDRVMGERDVAQLIMLGSPMGGSDCSVLPAALGFYLPASLEIRSSYMEGVFNPQITRRRGVPFHDLAGTQILEPYQSPCTDVPNDTVVSLGSVNAIPLRSNEIATLHSEMTASPEVFASYVRPLLQNPPAGFPVEPDPPAPAASGSQLPFTRVYRGHIEPGGSQTFTINIEPGISVAAFALYDPTRSTQVSVQGANGNVIELDPQANGFIRIEDPASMLYLGYGFSNPRPGPWKVTVLAADSTPASGADFAFTAYFTGGAVLQAASDTLIPPIGTQVTLTGRLILGGQPLEITEGEILVRSEDGRTEAIIMQPGLESENLWTPQASGVTGIDMAVTGRTPEGLVIERTAFLTVEVQPGASRERSTLNLLLLAGGILLIPGLLIFFIIRALRPRRRTV